MNQAQREYLNSVLNRNNDPSIYDEEDDLGQSSLNEAQKQLLIRLREQRKEQDSADDDPNAFVGGLSRGVDLIQRAYGSTLEGIGKKTGLEGLEEYGAGVAEYNQAQLQGTSKDVTRLDDVKDLSSFGSYAAGIAGESAPQMGTTIAGGLAGGIAGSWFPIVGTVIGAGIGAFVANMPYFYGSNRERQKEVNAAEGNPSTEISEGAAALTAIPQSALDSILTFFGAKYITTPLLNSGGGIFTRATQGAVKGTIIEVPTEIGQAVLERAQAGLPIANAEAGKEYIEAGVAAGLLGSSVGGTVGAVKRPSGEPPSDNSETNLGVTTEEAQNEGALAAEQELRTFFGDNWAESYPQLAKQYEEGDLNGFIENAQLVLKTTVESNKVAEATKTEQDLLNQGRVRSEAAKSFIPRDDFFNERANKRKADAVNPETEIGKEFELFKIRLQEYGGTPKADNDLLNRFLNGDKKQKTKGFITENDRELAIQEYNELLDAHAAGIADGTITPVANVDKTKAKNTKTTTETPVAETTETPVAETTETPVVETTVDNTTKLDEVVVKPPKESAKRTDARAYAEEKLGKNWQEESSSLSQMLVQDKNVFRVLQDGRTKWQKAVDTEVAARNEATTTPETTTDKTTDQSVNELTVTKVPNVRGLSNNEKKVFNVLIDYFVGDNKFNIDEIWAGGKFQATKLAELAGVKGKQAVNTAINRFKTKMLEQQGIISKNATKEDKDAGISKVANGLAKMAKAQRAATVEASRATDELTDTETVVDQRPDADEVTDDDTASNSIFQQQGMGTVDSVGQGNYTGVSEEDRTWTKAKATEKDEYADVRQERADNKASQDDNRLIQEYGTEGIRSWRNIKSDSAVDITALNRKDLREWLSAVEENLTGDITDAQLQQDQREIERRYDTDTPQNNTEGEIVGATTAPKSGNTTKQVGTQDNRETQSKEGDPDSFTAGKDQSGKVEVQTKSKPEVKTKTVPFKEIVAYESVQGTTDGVTALAEGGKLGPAMGYGRAFATELRQKFVQAIGKNVKLLSGDPTKRGSVFTGYMKGQRHEGKLYDVFVKGVEVQEGGGTRSGFFAASVALETGTYTVAEARLALARADELYNAEVDNFVSGNKLKKTDSSFRAKNTSAISSKVLDSKAVVPIRRVQRSAKDAPKGKTTVDFINSTIAQMFGRGEARTKKDGETISFPIYPDSPYSVFKVHKNAKVAHKQINRGLKRSEEFVSLKELETAQGVIGPDGVTTHLIADNIDVGTEKGVILHEVGVHLGLEKLLAPNEVSKLASAVNEWKDSPENSIERKIHDNTMARVVFARATGMHEGDIDIETIAYAVEEAVNMGIKPDAKSKSLAQKWLNDIQTFLSDLVSRFTNTTQQITPAELVSLSHGAAAGVYHQAYTELGATSKDNTIVADYYAGADRGVFIEDDAKVTRGLGRGGEVFSWGKNSRIGEYTDIRTVAGFEFQPSPLSADLEIQMDVYSGNMQEPLLTFEAFEIGAGQQNPTGDPSIQELFTPNLFLLTIDAGGMGKKIKSIGAGFGHYKRLEGVNQRDVMRLLAEFRRRITRHQFGLVPNVVFDRVTGAAAERTTTGREGAFTDKTLAKKFSMKKQDSGVSIQRAKGRKWVKSNLGDDAAQVYDGLTGLVTTPKDYLKFLYDFVHDAKDKMPSAKTVYNALKSHDAVRNVLIQEADKIAVRTKKLKPERYALLNDFLGKSTFFQKWGYDPKEYHPDVFDDRDVKIDPIMRIAFNRFNASEKQIIADIFAYGAKRQKEMQQEVKDKGITGNFFNTSSLKGPYAPLKRFGRHVTVFKSQQLLDAEKALDADQTTANRKALEKLKGDSKHYVVQFFDTKGAANRFAEQNENKYARVESFPRSTQFDNENAPPTQILESLLGKLKADDSSGLDNQTKEAFRTMIREHYYESIDSRDARTSGARRLNRAGYDKDMVRSFIFQARAGANLIATMKTSAEINEAMADAKKEASNDRGNLQETYELLSQHYTQMMRREDGIFNAIQDRVAAFNTVSMLTTNYAYHVQNATQVLIGVNKLVGDFGGYATAWAEMFKAYRIAHKSIKGGFFRQIATVGTMGLLNTDNNVEIDNTDGSMPREYQALVRELELHQLADVGIQEDLNQLNRFDTGFGLLNKSTDLVSGLTHRLYQVARYVEAHNRLSTAIAAYEMAKRNPQTLRRLKIDSPIEYSVTAVQHTQGAFNGLDAPLAIKKLPKLTTQYRKYQIMMAWNYGRAMKQAFAGETPEVKIIGWRTLATTLSHAAITTGIKGMPLMTPLAGLVMLWGAGDDDEFAEKAKANNGYTNYVEQVIRENVEDKNIANLLTRGVPAYFGLDFSGKIGHQNFFTLQPYSDLEWTRDGIASYLFDIFAGPTASTARNIGAGVEAISKGQELKGFGLMLPKGARHFIDSYIYATDGYLASNKDVILDPRSISLSELIMTATGMPSTEIQNLKFTRGQQFKMLEYFTESGSRIKREYVEAHKNRNRDKKSELRKEWRELQKAKDRVRPFFNDSRNILTRSSVMDLLKSTREQKKREFKLQKRLGTN